MAKVRHEVRDGLYGFIEFDSLEKRIIDSMPFQRLRHIHQLALSFHVYPGATHKRFEHALGVMEVATRIFDTAFDKRNLPEQVRERIAEEMDEAQLPYWRRVLRLAALLHDIGHLPFSHAAEDQLFPEGWNHERMTAEIIKNSEIKEILQRGDPPIRPDDIVDICWDMRKRVIAEPDFDLKPWKTLLNEIITGNTFGADRIDYLRRDSWHAGVAYGQFDPHRLIGGLRAMIDPQTDEIALGLDYGSIHAAEALLLARYFMYKQVYFHDVRRAYDQHLKDFLRGWLPAGKFPTDWRKFLVTTDNDVLVQMHKAAARKQHDLHDLAVRIVNRRHFRTVYELVTPHKHKRPTIFEDVLKYARAEFGNENVRSDRYGPKSEINDFPVLTEGGSVESSLEVSGVIANVPAVESGFVFVAPHLHEKAKKQIDGRLRLLLGSGPSQRPSKGSRKGRKG